ncbi:hypothetical protein, partial [Cyanobium sp. LEGE 06143]|uniref:hypothetical protein n=1 Tax=Cyanobium sp. LEGE 06143 TaxID=945727 RepID=UPI001D136E80
TPRFPAPDRPDPEARLLAAVAERDGPLARRLGERFVHRRGVVALESLLQRKLEPIQGAEACNWLAALVGVEPQVRPAAEDGAQAPLVAVAAAEPRAKDVIDEAPVADPWAPVASGLEGMGGFSAALSSAATLDSAGAESGAALIASWLEDLEQEQAELGQLAEAWKPAAEQLADAEPEVADPRPGEPKLAALQASDLMVFAGGGSAASSPAHAAPLPAQQVDRDPLLRRLQLVATPNGQAPGTVGPAPVPASLARLRSWLHDDQLPEAS